MEDLGLVLAQAGAIGTQMCVLTLILYFYMAGYDFSKINWKTFLKFQAGPTLAIIVGLTLMWLS